MEVTGWLQLHARSLPISTILREFHYVCHVRGMVWQQWLESAGMVEAASMFAACIRHD